MDQTTERTGRSQRRSGDAAPDRAAGGTPTRVAFHSALGGGASDEPVAEFRYAPGTGVVLTVFQEERGGRLCREYLARGVSLDAERRMVLPAEGEAFMRALLAPKNMSYYWFVDLSDEPGAASGPTSSRPVEHPPAVGQPEHGQGN